MKKYLMLLLWIFSIGDMDGQLNDTVSHEINLTEDKYLKISLIHAGSADLGDPEWLKLKIVNKSMEPIRITNANYAINKKEETNSGEKYIDHGNFGSGNQFELF